MATKGGFTCTVSRCGDVTNRAYNLTAHMEAVHGDLKIGGNRKHWASQETPSDFKIQGTRKWNSARTRDFWIERERGAPSGAQVASRTFHRYGYVNDDSFTQQRFQIEAPRLQKLVLQNNNLDTTRHDLIYTQWNPSGGRPVMGF